MGEKCFYQPQYLPPEPELIKFHDNVVIASNVYFVTHDVIHYMFRVYKSEQGFPLNLGAIEVGNNVFIGSNTTILPNTKIEDNVVIGAGSIVSGRIRGGGEYRRACILSV